MAGTQRGATMGDAGVNIKNDKVSGIDLGLGSYVLYQLQTRGFILDYILNYYTEAF